MIRQNLHTHSCYDDGRDPIKTMVESALEKGFTHLGFSGHGQNPADSCAMSPEKEARYLSDIEAVRRKYGERIQIFTGIEQDSQGKKYRKEDPFQYVIASVHAVPREGRLLNVDEAEDIMKDFLAAVYQGDFRAYARDYYAEVTRQADDPDADIIGHVDLLMKFNEGEKYLPFDDPEYLAYAKAAIDRLLEAGKIIEINTGAIARGYRSEPYPHMTLLRYIQEKGGRVMINTDCHDARHLLDGYEQALQAAREAGFDELMVFNGENFEPVSIEKFAE